MNSYLVKATDVILTLE